MANDTQDRYLLGYEAGYAAATRDRQNEIVFLMRLVERSTTTEVYIPFDSETTKRIRELYKHDVVKHDVLKNMLEHEETQNEAVKRFKAALDSSGLAVAPDGSLYYGME